jgi:uncharacterized membrane protein YsdA (DUF1294 family)
MLSHVIVAQARPIAVVAVALNALAWAAFRVDKALAQRGWRRISERSLLLLAALGGLGALLGMVAHRQRHKTSKRRFVVLVALATAAQLAGWAWLGVQVARAAG